jgi:hypothetical protein
MSPEDSDSDSDDEDRHWGRSPSPSPSIQKFAANFAQRVGSFMSNMGPRSPTSGMPSDAELEAEAEKERDRSRREAERIITQEAEERRAVEEKVLAMMANSRNSPASNSNSLPPPGRSHSLPNPPSPSPSQKEGGLSWWTAAKNKLTPAKEPLTPAQQIIQETKAREKEQKKNGKGKERDKEWPAVPTNRSGEPSSPNLKLPPLAIPRKPVPNSPSSPTPSSRNFPNAPPTLTPSPVGPGHAAIPSSPNREPPPLYAQFNSQGALDVHGTLLAIAKRFEKLEKWTVGHVRALEERMSDVERWLVDKEKEKEEASTTNGDDGKHKPSSQAVLSKEIGDIREEVSELQGRVGELGREMAKLATSSANLSSGPSREPAQVTVPEKTSSSILVHPLTTTPRGPSGTARESTSPPMASNPGTGPRSRLPYPTGDYASPPDSGFLLQGGTSQSNSPTPSVTSSSRPHPSTSGLPISGVGLGLNFGTKSSGQTMSTDARPPSPLSPPRGLTQRQSSASPTPRKRYTVALGNPIVAPEEREKRPGPVSFPRKSPVGASFLSEPTSSYDSDSAAEEDSDFQDETIGKSAAVRLTNGNDRRKPSPSPTPSPNSYSSHRKGRAQSVYGLSSIPSPSPVTPLNPRLRSSHSTDRFSLPTPSTTTALNGKFVDPLLLRKQEKEAAALAGGGKTITTGRATGKVPVGQLVAFFDGEK